MPIILAIDTSCDETAAAVTNGYKILSSVIDSQINIHAQYGGVVPFLAKRAHEAKIKFVVAEALKRAKQPQIDAVAVTVGPGLAPALEVGIKHAKKLALEWKKPLIAINHLEGHLLSSLANMEGSESSIFPAIGLIVSGGHTELILVNNIGGYQLIGQTLDDAAGEALDKLAKMLQLGYPGGPIIEEIAKNGDPETIKLPVPMLHSKDLNFSFSGLKTAAMYQIKTEGSKPDKKYIENMAAAFQQTIAISLCNKLKQSIKQYQPKTILLGGGVISNLYLRRQIRLAAKPLPVLIPYSKKLFTDNAAMIGIAAYHHFLEKDFVKNLDALDRQPNLNF